jgi:homogentisate 1,2-dioxygenase
VGGVELVPAEGLPLRHHHLRTASLPRAGDAVTGRVPLLFNHDVICYRCRPAQPQVDLFRNGAADEIVFIHQGEGVVETTFGRLPYRRGDYVVLPRMTTYRMLPKNIAAEDYFVLECDSPVRVPPRYLNDDGQILLGAPYYERDFHSPLQLEVVDEATETPLIIKDGPRLTRTVMAHHPLDVIGWDGFLYPYTFNAWNFEPLTGTVHLPPPFQQTFECRGFVVCTFAPRHLDHHPEAIKVPYAHSNVQADEVLFYVDGQFGSRRGVEIGSITLHPGGIPHGPHPGTIVASQDLERTEEMAVMFDTDKPLHVTRQALDLDDPSYPLSWLE